jgi:hypothetical protein
MCAFWTRSSGARRFAGTGFVHLEVRQLCVFEQLVGSAQRWCSTRRWRCCTMISGVWDEADRDEAVCLHRVAKEWQPECQRAGSRCRCMQCRCFAHCFAPYRPQASCGHTAQHGEPMRRCNLNAHGHRDADGGFVQFRPLGQRIVRSTIRLGGPAVGHTFDRVLIHAAADGSCTMGAGRSVGSSRSH